MNFAVEPEQVKAVGKGFLSLADTVQYAYFNAEVDMAVDKGGGRLFGLVVDEVEGVRTDLMDAFEPRGAVARLFEGAGDALIETARDYRGVDAAARAEIDAQLPAVAAVKAPWTTDDPGVDTAAYREAYAPVSTADNPVWQLLEETLGIDGPDQVGRARSAFESYDDFVKIAEDVDYVIGFDWVGDVLGGIGLPDPISGFKDELEGDWGRVGRALGALELVAKQERAYAADLDGMIKHLSGVWEGNAANSCKTWIASTGDKIGDHASDLGRIGSRIKAEAMTMKSGLDAACTAIDMIVDLLPDPGDLRDGIFGLVGMAKQALKSGIEALTKALDLFKIAFDLIMTAGFGVVGVISQITRFASSEWPPIPALEAPDVNGPAA